MDFFTLELERDALKQFWREKEESESISFPNLLNMFSRRSKTDLNDKIEEESSSEMYMGGNEEKIARLKTNPNNSGNGIKSFFTSFLRKAR